MLVLLFQPQLLFSNPQQKLLLCHQKCMTQTHRRHCTLKIRANTHTHTPLTPSFPVDAPQDQQRDCGEASGPGRCDDPTLTECQYKAIYKRMKNRPPITGNFSALLPQEAWPALWKWGDKGDKGEEGEERGDHSPVDVITAYTVL